MRAAQIRLLYAQSGIGSVGAFLGAVILGGALWKVVSHDRIVVWVLAYVALFLGRYCLIYSFHSRERDEDAVIRWGKWHTWAVTMGGLMWGLAVVWLFPQDSILHQFLLSIFVAGIAAAAAVVYSPTNDYASNLSLALLPLSGRFIYEFDEFHVTIGGVILLFAGALLLTGRRMHKVYADSLRLRFDKEEVVEDLKHEIARRDRLETELKIVRDELEMRVGERTAELKALNRTLEQEIVERKQADEELKKSEEKYRLLAENATDMVWTLDLKTLRLTYISPSVQKIRGYSPAEAGELPLDKTLTPDSYACAMTALGEELGRERQPGVHSDRTRLLEFREFCKDGSIVETEARIKFLRDVDGLPTGLLGITREVTKRKQAEEALKASEQRYRAIFDNASVGIDMVDAKGRFLQVNDALTQMLGYSREELLKLTIFDVSHPDDVELSRLYHDEMVLKQAGPYRFQKRYVKKDGCVVWADVYAYTLRDSTRGYVATIGVISDITQRVNAEAERGRLASAIEQAAEVVVITDVEGDIQYVNPAFEKVTGYTRSEAIGRNPRLLKSGEQDHKFYKQLWDTIKGGQVWSGRLVNRKKDGNVYQEEATISPVKDASGKITNFVAVKRDITEHLELSRQLLQAQKMEAVGTLAGGIAHDFNNLLTVVMGFSELLLAERDEKDAEYADLHKIFRAAKNGAELVQRLLMFSRRAEPKPVPMNLNKQIVEVEKLLRRTIPKMVDIHLDLSPALPEINADLSQVEQVLMNLAVNARDAMQDGGNLTVSTQSVTLDEEYCGLHVVGATPGDYVLLKVSDTGQGMDMETVEHIFEPFFTTKEVGKGTGLGLAMVYGIVKQHNGHITVYSEVGKGTTFRVYFPAIPADVEPDVGDSGIMLAFGTETVLLVDDEEFIRELGARMLTKCGYTVLQAENGRDALDLFERQRSQISLVILDLIMPEMGGTECLKELLKIDPKVNVLVASGYFADASVREIIQMGAKGFVTKPFRVNELLQEVRGVLDKG